MGATVSVDLYNSMEASLQDEIDNLKGRLVQMKDNDTVAGEVMATVMSLTDEDGKSIAERMSVADLWLVIQHAVMTIRQDTIPADLTMDEAMIWASAKVRTALRSGQKIIAIKEARELTHMSLKESKDVVERMIEAGLGDRK